MPIRVLITGAGGQLGRALATRLSARWETIPLTRRDLDIENARQVEEAFTALRPHWVVNCAAWTHVDGAEKDPDGAFRANERAVGFLAEAAQKAGARLCHFSTDYVFDGQAARPYREDDPTGPLNVYGASKLAGERRLLSHPARSAILRTSWLYSEVGKNFFRAMLRLGRESGRAGRPLRVVDDQTGTPTDAHSLAIQVEEVLREDLRGLFHAACLGQTSWHGFAAAIFQLAGMEVQLEPIPSSAYPGPARRPKFSVLENQRLNQLGKNRMMGWQECLKEVLSRFRQLPKEEME
ncbi:MAG: dTDP-4-dehydrorhamnose reductase [Planctomycetes bacterium]|nr:dTDP-4-dehydrorhamnose reductase [Planctomycetota bacterium]